MNTTPTSPADDVWARAEAKAIIKLVLRCGDLADAARIIEKRLLAARSVPEGMVRVGTTDHPMACGFDGMPTRLDITCDGFVVGRNAKLWRFNKASEEVELLEAGWRDQRTGRVFAPWPSSRRRRVAPSSPRHASDEIHTNCLYSTYEAALAANKEPRP